MRSVDENKAALLELGSSPAIVELPLWWLTQVPDILQWSSISAIASRMSNTPTIDELNDWGTILNSKGTDHQ